MDVPDVVDDGNVGMIDDTPVYLKWGNKMYRELYYHFTAENATCKLKTYTHKTNIYLELLTNDASRPKKQSGMAKKLLCFALKYMRDRFGNFNMVDLGACPLGVDDISVPKMTQEKLNSYYASLGFTPIENNCFIANIDDLIANCEILFRQHDEISGNRKRKTKIKRRGKPIKGERKTNRRKV